MSTPDVLCGRYELHEPIGAGGSAHVYRALDRTLDRPVAVKVLDRLRALSADPAGHARFVREGRSAARFTHPNVVTTFDAGEDGDVLFIVMEFVDGGSLAQRIADAAPLDDDEVVATGRQLLSALGAAHAAGIVHRDVKPANVLLDADGTVKLTDFGIAHRFDEITAALTADGMVVGTREYLAPEQARGGRVGPGADIYAVGAVLYEMATGRRPPVPSVGARSGADPRAVREDVGVSLATAISTALAPDPHDRYESAGAMSAALAGDTATVPRHQVIAAMPGGVGAGATVAMPGVAGGVGDGTTLAMLPHADAGERATRDAPGSLARRRAGWTFGLVAAVVLAGVVAVGAFGGDDPDLVTGATRPEDATPPAEDAAPITSATEPPPTAPPPTAPPPTAPRTEQTAPLPTAAGTVELIPGFPEPADLDDFVEQLRDKDSVAGKQSKKLGDKLRDIGDEDDLDKREERVEQLEEDLEEWLEDGELHPAVAERAAAFIDELGG